MPRRVPSYKPAVPAARLGPLPRGERRKEDNRSMLGAVSAGCGGLPGANRSVTTAGERADRRGHRGPSRQGSRESPDLASTGISESICHPCHLERADVKDSIDVDVLDAMPRSFELVVDVRYRNLARGDRPPAGRLAARLLRAGCPARSPRGDPCELAHGTPSPDRDSRAVYRAPEPGGVLSWGSGGLGEPAIPPKLTTLSGNFGDMGKRGPKAKPLLASRAPAAVPVPSGRRRTT